MSSTSHFSNTNKSKGLLLWNDSFHFLSFALAPILFWYSLTRKSTLKQLHVCSLLFRNWVSLEIKTWLFRSSAILIVFYMIIYMNSRFKYHQIHLSNRIEISRSSEAIRFQELSQVKRLLKFMSIKEISSKWSLNI